MNRKPALILLSVLVIAALVVTLLMLPLGGKEPAPTPEASLSPAPEPTATAAPEPSPSAEPEAAEAVQLTPPPAMPNPFLNMTALDINEQPFDTESIRGMPLMLNFWASWCGPCISEMPDLSELSREYAGRIQILGIMSDSMQVDAEGKLALNRGEIDAARAYYEKAGIAYPSLIANDLMLGIMSQLQMSGIPTTLFIDPQGYLRVQPIVGARDKATWQQIIDGFLKNLEEMPGATEAPGA